MKNQGRVCFMQGNEACAEGAFAAGARFYAGYPITPSSEIAEIASRRLPELGGVYLQMEDELASMAAVIGASLAGTKAFTATSGPGFSLMQENLGMAIMGEVPCVLIDVQRSGPSTGMATRPAQADIMQARWGTHGDHAIIALSPASVQECFNLTVEAFNLSERFRTPVIVLADEVVGHMRERIVLPDYRTLKIIPRRKPTGPAENYLPFLPDADDVPPLAEYGSEYLLRVTGTTHDETGYPPQKAEIAGRVLRRLYDKIYHYRAEITMTQTYQTEDMEILLIACGAASRAAWEAMLEARREGRRVGLLRLITVWPFADAEVARLCAQAKAVVVPEMSLGQLAGEVQRASGGVSPVHSVTRCDGELLTPEEILAKIREVG